MESPTLEKVLVTAMIENLNDLFSVQKGQRLIGNPEQGGEHMIDAS